MHSLIEEYETINKKKKKTEKELMKIEEGMKSSNATILFEAYPIFFGALIFNALFLYVDIGMTGIVKLLFLLLISVFSLPLIIYTCRNAKSERIRANYDWYFICFSCGIVPIFAVIAFPVVLVKGTIDLLEYKKAGGFNRRRRLTLKELSKKHDSLIKDYKEFEEKENSLVMTIKENELALNELQNSSKNKSLLEKISIILEREYSHKDIVTYHIANKQKQYIQND